MRLQTACSGLATAVALLTYVACTGSASASAPSVVSNPCAAEVMRQTPKGPVPSNSEPSNPRATYTAILVTVNPDGSVKAAKIIAPSGFSKSDSSALNTARASKYKPKIVNCKPTEGTYLYVTVWGFF